MNVKILQKESKLIDSKSRTFIFCPRSILPLTKFAAEVDRGYIILSAFGKDLPNVFDRFYKSDKSRGLDRTGVGLGLYIVKTIMDNLGEQISVDSVQGEYCNFTLTLTKYTGKLPAAQEQRIDKKE